MLLLSGVVLGKRGLQNAKEGGVGSLGTWSLIMVYLCWHLLGYLHLSGHTGPHWQSSHLSCSHVQGLSDV